jgi:AraC-like DNA-binding protein
MKDLFDTSIQKHVNLPDVFRIQSIYTAFERFYDYNYQFRGERHNFWELVIVMDGQIGVTANTEVFTLSKGQAILHEPMEFHRLWNVENQCTTIIVFSFKAESVPNYHSKTFEIQDINAAKNVLRRIQSAFCFENRNLIGIKDGSITKSQIALKYLETFVLELFNQQMEVRIPTSSRSMKNYTTIVNILESNVDQNLDIAEIARLCNMSEINLKQTFSKYAGMGIKNYFNRLKVNAAIPMIQNGATVQEVSDSLGFSSPNYFSTVFKRITGHVPSYYR